MYLVTGAAIGICDSTPQQAVSFADYPTADVPIWIMASPREIGKSVKRVKDTCKPQCAVGTSIPIPLCPERHI